MMLNKNQLKLFNETMQLYVYQPICGNVGYLPTDIFWGYIDTDSWRHTLPVANSFLLPKIRNYDHWFSIYDEQDAVSICSFYYPKEKKGGELIEVICKGTYLEPMTVTWKHGIPGLIKGKLMYFFYLTFIQYRITETFDDINLRNKLKLIKKKLIKKIKEQIWT